MPEKGQKGFVTNGVKGIISTAVEKVTMLDAVKQTVTIQDTIERIKAKKP